MGGQTASVEFTSPDANATASGIPGWFQGVQRTSSPIAGDLHRITVSWSYADNWLPGQETATRSATITAGSYSETIEQAGVDNTYTFSIPSQRIDTDPVAREIEFRVYGNVGGSPFAMSREAGWFTAGSSLMQNALIYVVPADDPQYGLRRVYSAIRLNVEGNHAPDAVTTAREAVLRIGPPGEPGASITVHQAGVDNTYQVLLPPALPGGGGDEFVVVDAAISGSGYTHASSSPWLAVLPSRSYQTIAYPRTDGSGRFFDQFGVRAEDQGDDKTKWYEPRTGTILIQGKPYAIEQLGAGAKFESVSVESNSQVAISYRLGHQSPASFVALEYSLDGTAYTSIPLESCFGASGHLGEGVDPGVHSFVWDARGLVATLFEEEDEVTLRVVATGGWQATSEAFTLQRHCECGDCPPGRVTAAARQSISIEIPLGADSLGRSFGRFRIHEETATTALGTPAVLERQALNGARTFPANAKRPTQFLTPAILAEISDPDPNDQTWSLRFYDRATQLGPFVPGPGLYNQAAATPFQQITFSLVRTEGRFIQSFNVTETGVFGERTHAFPWTNPNLMSCRWDLRQTGPGIVPPPSAVRRESISEEVSPDGRIRTKERRITSGDNVLASRSVSTSETFAFGTRRTRIERSIVQPDGSSSGSRSSFFVYEEDATKPGYGRITETYTDYDASWTAHRYNASGRSTILRPYRSAGRGSPEAALDVTRISKHTGNFGLGPLEDHARITSRSLADEVVSRTVTISYQDVLGSTLSDGATPFNYREKWTIQVLDPDVVTAGEALASPVSLITRQRIYADGDFAGETRSLLFPDGTISIFEYKADETVQWSGVPSADGRSITQGIRETETTNAFGQLVAYQAVAIPENLVIDEQVVLEQDELGRATKIRHLDGSISRRQYSCCGLISETGRDGVTTSHIRDHLGRLWSSTSLGKTTAYQLSPLGSVRSVTQSGGTLSIQRATLESDSLGIDRRSTAPGNRVTRTVQSHDANGQRQETLTRPDGGTVVQRYFRDGRLQSVSGTA
ncbi:MAG: hypothetical protein KGS60_19590, partial [Verrucomicrobia bacterium]|nr:hypothetical protein [Verrucomicrobiota bacterium]